MTQIPEDPIARLKALKARDDLAYHDAFRRLVVDCYERLLYIAVYSKLRDHHGTEDIVLETFFRCHKYIDSIKEGSLRPWLLCVAINQANDNLRRQGRNSGGSGEEVEDVEDPLSAPCDLAIQVENKDRLNTALGRLAEENPNHHQAVVLYYFEYFSVVDIVAIMQVPGDKPEGTVNLWLHRGRKKLRELMTENEKS